MRMGLPRPHATHDTLMRSHRHETPSRSVPVRAPDVLQLAERPDPEPKAGEILIRVAAAGINRLDVFQRTGNYPVPPGASTCLVWKWRAWWWAATFRTATTASA